MLPRERLRHGKDRLVLNGYGMVNSTAAAPTRPRPPPARGGQHQGTATTSASTTHSTAAISFTLTPWPLVMGRACVRADAAVESRGPVQCR